MGNFTFFVIKTWISRIIAIGLLLLSYKILENLRFETIDYFIRDGLQYLNSPDEVDKSFVTLNININSDGITTPHTYDGMRRIIDKLQEYSPKNIIVMMEPLDFSTEQFDRKKLYEYFKGQKNLYLNRYEARNELVSFAKDELFKNFERWITFDRCMDSPKDRESRRAFLAFKSFGETELLNQIKILGYNPIPIKEIDYKFEHWNTLQAYIKNYELGTYGNFQSHDLLQGTLGREAFRGKTVILGTNDEFSMLTSKSIFSPFANRGQKDIQLTRVPLQDVFANILNFHTTGIYIKYLKNVNDLAIFVILLALLLFSKIKSSIKIYVFLSLLPLILLFQIGIYLIGSFYVDFSRSIVFIIATQYFVLPLYFIRLFKKIEKARLSEINNARIDSLLAISSAVAHDLRSPLSTINLLLSKAHFTHVEHKKLVQSSIERLNAVIENLVKKHREDNSLILEKIDLAKALHDITQEKIAIAEGTSFENNVKEPIYALVDKSSFERVVSNILDNSIDATKSQAHRRISISAQDTKNEIHLIFSDNGPGVPKAILHLLGAKAITTKGPEKGNGIGLLHSARILERMRGKLVVESPESGGTKVHVKFSK